MKPKSLFILVSATLLALGTAYWLHAAEPKRVWPKPTPPPPPSPVYQQSKERVPSEADIENEAALHNARLELAIEGSLLARNPDQRETAFVFLLPELLQLEPERVVALVARQEGKARDILRKEVARQWVAWDVPAAVNWMKTLDDGERLDSAKIAVATIAPYDLPTALIVAADLGVGRNDDSLEYLVQRWATDDLEAATRWIGEQPNSPRFAQFRARIDHVRRQLNSPEG